MRAAELFQDVEALPHGADGADSQLAGADGDLIFVASRDENRSRLGIDRDVEAVLRAIVDDDVEVQRVGNFSARPVDHEH